MNQPGEALALDMRAKGIDIDLSLSILDDYNSGLNDAVEVVKASRVPAVDGERVLAIDERLRYSAPRENAEAILASIGMSPPASASSSQPVVTFDFASLSRIGQALLPRAAFGILNGGSATSYADRKKNLAYGEGVFSSLETGFATIEPLCHDRPKGLAPAYVNPDGSPGASFLLLKMRARLLALKRYRDSLALEGRSLPEGPFLPLYQMTSSGNDAELSEAYQAMASHPLLRDLASSLGGIGQSGAVKFATGVQPMIAAFSHSSEGRPKKLFDKAWGKSDSALALPGGHGQSFRILTKVFRDLQASGLRWAWLGNVDNIGYLPDPAKLAVLALSGEPAAFEFSFRTALDVKGGILVETGTGGRTIADIGPAISFEELRRLEDEGAAVLFNCATGLFDLDWLVPRLEELGRRLPVRFTDQDKDAGRYSQAEQVTWEVASLLPSFLAYAVEKKDRFISAKLLVETLLTSGLATG
ncbi:MAG: UTP--glucose-1-phosphate uridylyltransferase, partial [Spirochaetota bacterium]